MEIKTHEELKNEFIGKVGTKKRYKYDEKVQIRVQQTDLLYKICKMCKSLQLNIIKDSCNDKEYNGIKSLRRMSWTKIDNIK